MELVKAMEEKFGVSDAAPVAVAAGPAAAGAAAAEEQTEFTVNLKSAGEKKVEVIKVVRAITGMGRKEERKSVAQGKGVSVGGEFGGRWSSEKKKKQKKQKHEIIKNND